MGWWGQLFLFSHLNPYEDNILWYGRYIDDLVLIWTDVSLAEFWQYANDNSLNLEFLCESGITSVPLTTVGEFIQAKRNCSTPEAYENEFSQLLIDSKNVATLFLLNRGLAYL